MSAGMGETGEGAGGITARWAGLVVGPLLAAAVYALSAGGPLAYEARVVAALATLMATWWLTEALPIAVTALLPVALLPLLNVSPIREVCGSYANEVVFMFLGGFLLGLTVERWGLHRRIALAVLWCFGGGERRLVGGFMLATALISMWVSNTATTMMMMPIAASVVGMLAAHAAGARDEEGSPRPHATPLAKALVLGVAYAASIGGMGTYVGTPPNTILRGFMVDRQGPDLGFGAWMIGIGVPTIVLFLPLAWLVLTRIVFRLDARSGGGPALGRDLVSGELRALGPLRRGEWMCIGLFGAAVTAWMFREPLAQALGLFRTDASGRVVYTLTDAGIAVLAGVAMFAIPVEPRRGVFLMDWEFAKGLPWSVLLLTGGGLALADAMTRTRLDAHLAAQFAGLHGMPTWLLTLVLCAGIVALSELASNAAVTSAALPVLWPAAQGIGVHPYLLIIPATLAASAGFMLPVATPPNGIAYATGWVKGREMAKAGLWLDVIAVLVITLWMTLAGPAMVARLTVE
ncbi:MAG: SLC13/DASS family transporter [Phycisphaerae bacterium]|nr:SLC13/DASS family transporter [Phycisphaerae bacterium]